MASRNFAKLVSCFSLRSFQRGAVQQNVSPKLFSLCRLSEKNTALRKITNFSPVCKKCLPASIDGSTEKDEGREGSRGSWQSWSSAGTVLMVGGLVLSSENRNDQGENGAERSELRDGQGRFSSKTKLEKCRSGHQRTLGIREWRAKRKLDFEENPKLIPVETRASKVRVHFQCRLFLRKSFPCPVSSKPRTCLFMLLPYQTPSPPPLPSNIVHISWAYQHDCIIYFPALQLYIYRTKCSSNFKIIFIRNERYRRIQFHMVVD